MRDGLPLALRAYAGKPGKGFAIVMHGSSGSSIAMHPVAKILAAEGITAYAIDLRGHGESGPLGDVAYRGQWTDDMEDLVANLAKRHPGEKKLLIGHSQAGGFTLKVAASRIAAQFDGFMPLSPLVAASDESLYRADGGWADAAVPRIIALSLLNQIGISALDGLPVVAYAVPPNYHGKRTTFNSWRLLNSSSLPRDWKAAVSTISRPVSILIGEQDELFNAPNYPSAFKPVNDKIAVAVLPTTDHMQMVYAPHALAAIAEEAKRMLK